MRITNKTQTGWLVDVSPLEMEHLKSKFNLDTGEAVDSKEIYEITDKDIISDEKVVFKN